jgi:hypothetical protein
MCGSTVSPAWSQPKGRLGSVAVETLARSQRLLRHVARPRADRQLTASICHSAVWPECPRSRTRPLGPSDPATSASDIHTETLPATRGPVGRQVARAVGWRHAAGGAQIVAHYQQVTRVDPDYGAVAFGKANRGRPHRSRPAGVQPGARVMLR